MTIETPPRSGSAARIETDICIIGAGAAGLAIAREMIGKGVTVSVLAGGAKTFSHRAQFLYHGRNVGRESFAPGKARFRMFGGSTTRWAGQCRPFDPVDFEARPNMPGAGWPIESGVLEPYYRRAAALCDLDDWRFDPPVCPGLDLPDDGDVEPVRYRHGQQVDFAQALGPELEASDTVRVFLDTHAVEIVASEQQVSHIDARSTGGHRLVFSARTYILACGGIENARLLLASRATGANGLGNANDLVGRYFMDHPFFFGGSLDLAACIGPEAVGALEGYEQAGIAQRSHGAFALSERLRREAGVNGAAVFFVSRAAHKSSPRFLSRGGVALTRVVDVLMHRELPDGRMRRHLPSLLLRPGEVGASALERVKGAIVKRRTLAARFTLETAPNPDSRVRLDPTRRDRFGMPQVTVDWRLRDSDLRGLDLLQRGLTRLFADGKVGQLNLHGARDADGYPVSMEGGKHHMGTTRMSHDPETGVVDSDCRMHAVHNLYVAGSSVFPTAGYVNPTLTIVALALRLADHLLSADRSKRPVQDKAPTRSDRSQTLKTF